MTIDLSFTQESQWRAHREEQWQMIEELCRAGYGRKVAATVKRYYFEGKAEDTKGLSGDDIIKFFPLRTPEGWSYAMQHNIPNYPNVDEFRRSKVHDPILNGLLTYAMREIGRDWSFEEQCALFDWLVGPHYQPEISPPVPMGPRGQVARLKLKPDSLYHSAVCGIASWLKSVDENEYRYNLSVWIARLDYLFEFISLVDERVFDIKLHSDMYDAKKDGGRIDGDQICLQTILSYMKNYPLQEIPTEELAKRQAFLKEFHQRLENLTPKPGQLQQQLDNLNQ